MKNKFVFEVILAVILIGLLVLAVNPMDLFMPSPIEMMLVWMLTIVFAAFTGFVIKEQRGDEREQEHRSVAGRAGFLVGCASLLIGIITQMLSHNLDIWLVITLVAMVIAKIATRIYYEINS